MTRQLIAVVDDDEPYIDMICEVLEDEGYNTVYFFEGKEAIKNIPDKLPDLVILDLVMETRDAGISFLKTLRSDATTAKIPVIVCSADSNYLRQNGNQLRSCNT